MPLERPSKRDPAWATLAPALLLLPFLGKAFHIDDDLFLQYARPLTLGGDPYDITFIHGGAPWPLFHQPNPLGWLIVLAALRRVFGESEVAMHLATFAFAPLGLHGLALLARRLGVSATNACAFLAGASAFLCMGSTIMPDVPFAACTVAALARLVRGVDEGRTRDLILAGVLAVAAFLLRYTGALTIGLLLAYPVLAGRWRLRAFVPFAVGAGLALAWDTAGRLVHGESHFLHSVSAHASGGDWSHRGHMALAEVIHLGAQAPLLLPLAAALFARVRGIALAAAALAGAIAWAKLAAGPHAFWPAIVFAWPGLIVLLRAAQILIAWLVALLRRRADGPSPLVVFLAAWALPTTFATVGYWHVAAKYMLLPLPAVILLLLDWLPREGRWPRMARLASAILTVTVGMMVAVSDHRFAGVYRDYYERDWRRDAPPAGGTAYVAGEWGLHYYGERLGLQTYANQGLGPNDRLIFTEEVPGAPGDLDTFSVELSRRELTYPGPFAILNRARDAGFYSNAWGTWPFVWSLDVRDRLTVRGGR